jgi:hypothetical protein
LFHKQSINQNYLKKEAVSQPQVVPKQPQAVSTVLVSGKAHGFLPAGQPVSKVLVSGMEYGFLPDSRFQSTRRWYHRRTTTLRLQAAATKGLTCLQSKRSEISWKRKMIKIENK